MTRTSFTCAFIVLSCLQLSKCDDSKIVGGFKVYLKNIPFATSLQFKGMHFCGGALVTLGHVLSGCHCLTVIQRGNRHEDVRIRSTTFLTAVVGAEYFLDTTGYHQWSNVKEIKIHPKCSFVHIMVFDFALAYLESPFEESLKVKPFTMYAFSKEEYDEKTNSLVNSDKSYCYVAGWGAVDPKVQTANPFIKAARMRLITEEECRNRLGRENVKFLAHNFGENAMVCSLPYGPRKNESDCAGDSGGPFFCGSTVYGIVSFGYDCGHWDSPNVYAKLSYAVDWLLSENIFPKNASESDRSLKPNYNQANKPMMMLMSLSALFFAIKIY